MNNTYKAIGISLGLVLSLWGCLPFSKETEAQKFVVTEKARTTGASFQKMTVKDPEIYVSYRVKDLVYDPFKVRQFLTKRIEGDVAKVAECPKDQNCVGDGAPALHSKQLLENYDISSLLFVGVMAGEISQPVALIKTADLGVIPVGVGAYLGKDNGLVISVSANRLEIQEKMREANVWRNRRRIMIID